MLYIFRIILNVIWRWNYLFQVTIKVFKDLSVGQGGLEPPTSPLSGVRSNQLSYRPMGRMKKFKNDL